MTYAEALEYLASIEGLGIKLALRNITQVLSALGEPQRAFTSVLVAGTNGKGSVAAMLESILRHAGHGTGLYTSPHLIRHEERVQVGGRPVGPETLAEAVGKVKEAIDRLLRSGTLEAHPTHFETFTAAAFVILAGAGVRTAVLEVGMGGRLDATVLAEPAFSILTNVSLEHTQYLGTTIGAIAREKAGVLRKDGTLLAGERHPDAVAAFRARAGEVGGHVIDLDDYAELTPREDRGAGSFDVRTRHRRHRDLACALRGSFQLRNALTAVAAADLLDAAGTPVPPDAVAAGLAGVAWPGRFQIVEGSPRLLLDGSHNPAACRRLREAVDAWSGGRQDGSLTLLFGALRDKDHAAMLAELLPAAGRVVLTRGASPRFRDPWTLLGAARATGLEAHATGTLEEGLARARETTPDGGTICVTGSLYLVGDAMTHLGIEPWPLAGRASRPAPTA